MRLRIADFSERFQMPTYPRAKIGRYAIVISVGFLIVIASAMLTRAPEKKSGTAPGDDTIVARMQTTGTGYSAALQKILRETRARPTDLTAAKAAARALIAEGRTAGDSRLVGAATGVLHPFMVKPDAETLYLVATARQYQHDFTGAMALLDQAVTLEPGDANVLLTRATIQIVLGKFDLAVADCQRIAKIPRPDLGFLCQSTALLLTKQAPEVYARLDGIVARPGLLDPALRGWAIGLMGEIAKSQGNIAAA